MITDDNATTWRDLIGQRTPEQIAELERDEPHWRGEIGDERTEALLLRHARWEVEQNLHNMMFDVPAPDGAAEVFRWQTDSTGRTTRLVSLSRRTVEGADASVEIVGPQDTTGAVDWELYAYVEDKRPLTSAQARELAAVLLATADQFDQLTS
jgi:hypothetical protein